MAIRDRFSRMLHKSMSSSSPAGHSEDGRHPDIVTVSAAATTITTSAPSPPPLSKTTSRLAKMKSWRSSGGSSTTYHHHQKSDGTSSYNSSSSSSSAVPPPQPPARKPNKSSLKQPRPHPSERPLTEQNLRHQEMLGAFTIKFGRTRGFSRGARSSFSGGISPGNSRPGSLDLGGGGGGVAPDEVITEESS